MDILDQKLGTVGDIHVSVVNGQLVAGVDADVDLVTQLQKLQAAHSSGLLGNLLGAAASLVASLTAAPATPAAPAAPATPAS